MNDYSTDYTELDTSTLKYILRKRDEEIAALKEESRKRMIALESLTCGGSEYVGDVERCVEYIRRGQESMRRGFGAKIKDEKARADQAEAELKAIAERDGRLAAMKG